MSDVCVDKRGGIEILDGEVVEEVEEEEKEGEEEEEEEEEEAREREDMEVIVCWIRGSESFIKIASELPRGVGGRDENGKGGGLRREVDDVMSDDVDDETEEAAEEEEDEGEGGGEGEEVVEEEGEEEREITKSGSASRGVGTERMEMRESVLERDIRPKEGAGALLERCEWSEFSSSSFSMIFSSSVSSTSSSSSSSSSFKGSLKFSFSSFVFVSCSNWVG